MTNAATATGGCLHGRQAPRLIRAALRCFLAYVLIPLWNVPFALAGEAVVAVATNFIPTFNELVLVFESRSPHKIISVPGSTGKIYSQIKNGAPFDIFLSADSHRPKILESEGAVVPNSRFLYAEGRLALWSQSKALLANGWESALGHASVKRVAIANPALAPYGSAALDVIRQAGLENDLESKVIQGDSVGQVYAHVVTGNAELGFVPLSYAQNPIQPGSGFYRVIPRRLHMPIRQEAVLLRNALENEAAEAFYSFLQSTDAKLLISGHGYSIDPQDD